MSSPINEVMVRHNTPQSRFEIEVAGLVSVADYERRGTDMVMTHTLVPPELRGRGLAEKLVRAAFEYARSERLRVVPVCSYVETFLTRNPEFKPLTL